MATMKDLVNLLGVELGEEFYLSTESSVAYRFSVNGLEFYGEYGWEQSSIQLTKFFTDNLKIIKKPWKPQKEETYYYVIEENFIDNVVWDNDGFDLSLYVAGNCFKSEEEAQKHKKDVLNRLKAIYEGESC